MASKPSMSVNLGLGAFPDVESQEMFAALSPIHNAIRNLGYALDAYTGNTLVTQDDYSQVNPTGQTQIQKTAVMYLEATEVITRGEAVSLFLSAGKLKVKRAQAGISNAKAIAIDSAEIGAIFPVCLLGLINAFSGLTIGSDYYLSAATPGAISTTVSTQYLGFAASTSALWFTPQVPQSLLVEMNQAAN